MTTQTESKDLRLTSQHIIDLIGDENFYLEVPTYFFMREQGLATHKQYMKFLRGELEDADCSDCSRESAKQNILTPALRSFTNVTLQLHRHKVELLNPLREYLQSKLRYPLGEVTVYYKIEDTIRTIVF